MHSPPTPGGLCFAAATNSWIVAFSSICPASFRDGFHFDDCGVTRDSRRQINSSFGSWPRLSNACLASKTPRRRQNCHHRGLLRAAHAATCFIPASTWSPYRPQRSSSPIPYQTKSFGTAIITDGWELKNKHLRKQDLGPFDTECVGARQRSAAVSMSIALNCAPSCLLRINRAIRISVIYRTISARFALTLVLPEAAVTVMV